VVVSASSSQPEAFGKVAIEAMAMGRPVIATSHGGSLETVIDGKTGLLVPPKDNRALAEAIKKLLKSSRLCTELGKNGQLYVLANFTARIMCERTLGMYQSLLEEKKRLREGKRLTVLQMLPELNSGGVERGTLEMGDHLSKQGHNSIVVSGGGRLVESLESSGSLHITRSVGSKTPLALFHLLPLRRLIKNDIDILHLRSRMPAWLGYIAWLSLAPSKRPVLVTTFHGFYSVNTYSAVMTKGDGVIAVSRSIQQHIAQKYKREHNVRLIFRGVEMDSFDPELVDLRRIEGMRNKWGIDRSKSVVMLPGRLTRLKGQEVFLRSLLLLKETEFQAVLVGDIADNPGYTAELREFIESNGLAEKVIMAGHCDDMAAAFLVSDIVVSASSIEPEAFGRTTVEAMAMGCPVIATAHGGSLEIVTQGENGWLVTPSDPVDLSHAIDAALATAKDQLREMGFNNRAKVTRYFTAKTMCDQTLSFYNDLIKEKGSEL
jgi:glycosyltransferase involved in cell wall biosynthesis